MINTLDKFKKRLLLPLPGKEAQFRMAPSYRPIMDETEIKQLAGVTILLYIKNNSLHFPLIVRPEYNGAHSGQISFPGGKMEKEDRSITITALRECEEEIGIDASNVVVLGSLTHLIIPVSKFDVYPIAAYYNGVPTFVPQASEVVSIIEVPLNLLLDKKTIDQQTILHHEIEEVVPFFNISNKMIWGATAMILSEFIQIWSESQNLYSETRFL